MEYFRDPNNQIQADIAYRLGIIAKQYSGLSMPEEENFSSTLDICILQNLLTNCVTLLDAMSRNESRTCYLKADLATTRLWGLSAAMIEVNTFRGEMTADIVLRRIRNALSHPTDLDLMEPFPSTGYTTIPDGSGTIRRYCLVNSPDTRNNRPKTFQTKEQANDGLARAISHGDLPADVTIMGNKAEGFYFGRDGRPFARVFKIHLTSKDIHTLVIGLSNHLAQPIQEAWDGVSMASLVT